MNDSPLPLVLSLCVAVLACLLFPPLGQALADGGRFLVSERTYGVIALVVLGVLVFEALFLLFLDQVLCARPKRSERVDPSNSVAAILLAGGAVIGVAVFAGVFAWAINVRAGPYW